MASPKSPRNGFACSSSQLKTTVDGIDTCIPKEFNDDLNRQVSPQFSTGSLSAPTQLGNFDPNSNKHRVVVDPRKFIF